MRRIVIERRGGPDRLRLIEKADPVPGPGEALVANEAVGVAFADVLMREGLYPGVRHPVTPGYEVVGRVVAAGAGAGAEGWVGRRAAALTVTGGYATHAVVPAADLVEAPDALPSPVVAALVLNGLTAWQMLTRVAPHDAERVLVWGAAGGVGSLLLDMARDRGVRAFGVASRGRLDFVAQRGATPVDRDAGGVAAAIMRSGGVDAVFDGVGGRTTAESFAALRTGGVVVQFGAQGAMMYGRPGLKTALEYLRAPRWSSMRLLMSGRGLVGYLITEYKAAHPERYRADLATVFDLAVRGRIAPVIGLTLPLADAAEAHRRMNAGDITGKIVLLP